MLVLLAALLSVTAYAIVALALPLLARRAGGSGLVDRPGGRKDHAGSPPLVGGIAVLLGVALPALGGPLLALVVGRDPGLLPAAVAVHLPGLRDRLGELLLILAGVAVMLGLGHLDDRRGLSPWLRLGVQTAAAAVVALFGPRVTLYLDAPVLHVLLTVGFIVFVTNATNFIDNMNGLLGGVTLVAALHLASLAVGTGQLFMAAILICLGGGLCAFLPRNFPVARVFMGDAGSLALGFLLACLAILFTYDERGAPWRALLLPPAVLAVPLLDGSTVVVSRLLRGVHPFTAGRDHLSHRLVRRGLSRVQAVVALWVLAFVAGAAVWLTGAVSPAIALSIWIPAAAVLALGLLASRREVAA